MFTRSAKPDRLQAHGRALIMAHRCPSCAEPISHKVLYRGRPCSRCQASLRQFSMCGQEVARRTGRKAWVQLALVSLGVALGYLALGWFPLLGVILMAIVAAWIRLGILYPLTEGMSPTRRLLSRWTARLMVSVFLSATLVVSELLLLFGPFGVVGKAVLGAVQVIGSATMVTGYVRWQLKREAKDVGPSWWEWGGIGLSLSALVVSVTGLVLALVMVVETIEWITAGLIR